MRRSRSRRPSNGASTVSTSAREPGLARLRDQLARDALVAEDVELEPAAAPPIAATSAGVEVASVERHMIVPAAFAARAIADLAVGMRDALERDRRDEQRHRHLVAEHRRRGRARVDVDEHARPELPAPERLDVVAQRQLVARAARVVAVRAGLEPLGREPLRSPRR